MTLLLLILFISTLVFLFYYELMWKKVEEEKGISLVSMARAVVFGETAQEGGPKIRLIPQKSTETNWSDWKYRLMVELHRRDQLGAKDAAELIGVSEDKVERYFDKLEGEGKIQQIGDAKRGIFYKAVSPPSNMV